MQPGASQTLLSMVPVIALNTLLLHELIVVGSDTDERLHVDR
jgi:hypothetical protein